ncbi:MAG: prenyltransferase/squalene oxidase repeat-containing protein, partial [Planctomycetota bacterium]
MIDLEQLLGAYQTARRDLLAQRVPAGHWVGELSSSALSTATATSALSVVAGQTGDDSRRTACRQLAAGGIRWLARCQNDDGGWGDTEKSFSNIATTMLARAAFHLAGMADEHADLLTRAETYIETQGGLAGLRRRYGKDKTFAVPILTNCALASLVPWREVAPLPFELACLPHSLFRFLRLPVVSYAIPALVAVGQARYFHRKPGSPFTRLIRRLSVKRSLKALERMQPASGGFLEAVPLTSFVVMSLAGSG